MGFARKRRWRPSPAIAISILALFVALSGTALALQANSVRSRHIVNGQVKTADLRGKAVKARKLGRVVVRSATVTVAPNATNGDFATCKRREVLLSGGIRWHTGISGNLKSLVQLDMEPKSVRPQVFVRGRNTDAQHHDFDAQALCLKKR